MRPIHGAAPGVSAAAHWAAIRDNAKLARPANPSEAVATGDIHTPMPPSKAHLRRLQGFRTCPAPRAYPPLTPAHLERDRRLDFHKRLIAGLGGDMTVKPLPGCERDEAFTSAYPHPSNQGLVR